MLLLLVAFILFAIEVAGWNLFAYGRYPDALTGADPGQQVNFILSGPIHFIGILLKNIWTSSLTYLRGWVALYGLDYWPVPVWVYYLYAFALLAAFFLCRGENTPERNVRVGLLITFVASYIWTILTLYLSYTPAESEVILGVQGRYFIGVMPLLFLALTCFPFYKQIAVPGFIPVLFGGLALVTYIAGMYLSYHVNCGSQYYTGGLCYQPNYKNWAPDDVYSSPLSASLSLRQEVLAECDGMTKFLVWMDASEADKSASTSFSLTDAVSGDVIVFNNVLNMDLPSKSWYILSFPPVWSSKGSLYLLDITTKQKNGPRIAYSLRQEYVEGQLYENNNDIPKDIIFKMGCVAGWDKLHLH